MGDHSHDSHCQRRNGGLRHHLDRARAAGDHLHVESGRPGAQERISFWSGPGGAMIASPTGRRALIVIGCALIAAVTLGAIAGARMRSTKISPSLCQTTGGGRFVSIPGFSGERIDRRLLTDIRWLKRRYRIFITDGYSLDDVHAENGEHPIGLALDIVPNKERGGTWANITQLARWAEPSQNHPRAPFRWVGYDGDKGHGRGNHLHLSWSHSVTDPGHTARTVYTVRCPRKPNPPETTTPTGGTGGDGPTGPTEPDGQTGTVSGSGGIGGKLAPVTVETGGVGLHDR